MQQHGAGALSHSHRLTYSVMALGVLWLISGLDASTARYVGSAWLWGITVPVAAAAILFPQKLREDIGFTLRTLMRTGNSILRVMRQPTSAF